MKVLKLALVIIAVVVMTIGLSSISDAFHSGGVGRCSGCHTMHNSNSLLEDTPVNPDTPIGTAGPYLLIRNDSSSTCLACHHSTGTTPSSFRVSSTYTAGVGPSQMPPGGDFGWLTKSFSWTGGGGTQNTPGYSLGHNIVAASNGYVADARHPDAPGGSYPSANFSCISCHDPHGKYRTTDGSTYVTTGAAIKESGSYGAAPTSPYAVGSYRLLAGAGYQPKSIPGAVAFVNDPPTAVAPSTYNRAETSSDTRVAYGKGMSEFCANCHGGFHNDSYPTNLRHPAGNNAKLTAAVAGIYNSYKKSGDLTGDQATAYWSLVPFERGTTDRTALLAASGITGAGAGPSTSDNVACITCHRPHATGWESAGRWNFRSDFVVYAGAWPGTDNGTPSSYAQGRTAAETSRAMYDRAASNYAGYQRSFCNKCHAKD